MRLEPGAIATLGRPSGRGERRDLGDQRQDDDGRDGGGDPRRRGPRACPQPRRSQHGRRRGDVAARRRRAGRDDLRAPRPVRGGRAVAGARSHASCGRGRSCSATCSATSSTATASSTRSPTAGARCCSPAMRRRFSTPMTRCSPTSVASATGVLYFGVEDDSLALPGLAHAADAKHCRNCGAPYIFDAVYLGHLGRYHCPSCGRARPRARRAGERGAPGRGARRRFTLTTPEGRAPRSGWRLPGLYNVYNALAAAALWRAPSVCRSPAIVAGLEATRPAFGRAETVTLSSPRGPREMRILLVKNPAGANEVLRTLALEPGEHELLGVLNDQIADGRDVSWIWDADFELLAGRVGGVICSGTPRRRPRGALQVRGRRGAPDPRASRSCPRALEAAAAAGRARAPALRAADLHGDAGPARAAGQPRRGGRQVVVMPVPARRVIWHDLECGGYRADLPLWRELAASTATGPAAAPGCSTSAAGSGRVAIDLARAGHRVTALDADADAARRRSPSAPAVCRSRPSTATPATSRWRARRLRPVPGADADRCSCCAGPPSGAACSPAPGASARGRAARLRDRQRGRLLRQPGGRPRTLAGVGQARIDALPEPRRPGARARSPSSGSSASVWSCPSATRSRCPSSMT